MIEQVKIGGIRYPVKIVDDLHNNHKELYGWIKYDKHEIHISSDLGDQGRYQTLWHEIVHGILNNAGISGESETTVDAIAHGVMQVLVDNPGIEKLPWGDSKHSNADSNPSQESMRVKSDSRNRVESRLELLS